MHAGGSSSANADCCFVLAAAETAGAGVWKFALGSAAGSPPPESFSGDGSVSLQRQIFLRREYLFPLPEGLRIFFTPFFSEFPPDFCPRMLSAAEAESLYVAARMFAAEAAAMRCLSRAEHSRFQLETKLRRKGFLPQEIRPALDFLEEKRLLDDRRFAGAWLRARLSSCVNGRIRLAAELAARGVSRADASAALEEFFTWNSEESLCRRAAEKLLRQGRTGKRLAASLQNRGFPAAMIRREVAAAGQAAEPDGPGCTEWPEDLADPD